MRLIVPLFAILIISPALFAPVSAVDVQRYEYGTIDPIAQVTPTATGYDFVFRGDADDYPLFGLACTNSPYPYINTIPLDTHLGFDHRIKTGSGDVVPYVEGMLFESEQDSRIFLTNNDIWTAIGPGARELGERLYFASDGNYTWPRGNTFQGPTIQWGLPQNTNQGGSTISGYQPLQIRTDYRHLYGDESFFTDNSLDSWLLVDNQGREMLNALGDEHANKNDFRIFVWDAKITLDSGEWDVERNTDSGRAQLGNYTYYQDPSAYFKITTDENDKLGTTGGADSQESYAYLLQWTAFYGGNRYGQGPDGNLQWYPHLTHLTTGFPGELLQQTNTLQMIDSYYLDTDGAGYTPQEWRKGDILVMMRTANISLDGEGITQLFDRISRERVIPVRTNSTASTYSDWMNMFLDVYVFDGTVITPGQPIFTLAPVPGEFTGKIVGYHLRPVYDTFSDDVEPRADDTMYIPGYDFSNNLEVSCRPFVWSAHIAGPEIIQYGDPIIVEPTYDCSETYHLPAIDFVTDHSIIFEDIVPEDYCTVRPEDQEIPFPPTIVPGPIPMYRDIVVLDIDHRDIASAHVKLKIADGFTDYTMVYSDDTVCGAYDPVAGELGSFRNPELSSGTESPLYTTFLDNTILYEWFYRDNPLVVNCQNLILRDSTQNQTVTFSKTLEASEPYYMRYIDAIKTDQWGWGVGESHIDDLSIAYPAYQNLVFGLPFVAVMGMLTAFVGFQRDHIPAAGITYGLVLGVMAYFEIIDIPVAAFGAIVTFVIILVFSKGFR